MALSRPPERIAVFRALQLGDLLCAVPALRALRAAWPAARITLVGLPWARDFAERLPYVDDFLEFPGFPGLPEIAPEIARLPDFFAAAQARRFDLALQMHGSGGLSNSLVAALGARDSAGFFLPGGWCPDPANFIAWRDDQHEIRRLLALVRFLGAPDCGEDLELPIRPAEARAFARLRSGLAIGPRGYVCIHPGARLASRRWLPERFARVADRLAAAGLAIVLTGTREEAPLLAAVRDRMRSPAIDLAGHTGLGTLAALVAQARLVVCNDTAMSHIAAAVGTPSVVVSLGADPRRWQPLDHERHHCLWHPVACRPCAHRACPTGHECALGIEADLVIAHALSVLAKRKEADFAPP